MANQPVLNARVTITTGGVAKQFNAVTAIHIDYSTGRINIVDATGSFYFGLTTITSFTYTITTGVNGVSSLVIS